MATYSKLLSTNSLTQASLQISIQINSKPKSSPITSTSITSPITTKYCNPSLNSFLQVQFTGMNYETYIKVRHHLKTLHKLNKLTKEERTFAQRDLRHLIDGNIFYSISAWPPSIKEIFKHDTITNKNTFKLNSFCLW